MQQRKIIKIMSIEQIKELLGDKIYQCTDENFKIGYDPITEIIDQLEIEQELSFDDVKTCEDYWEETEEFLLEMELLNPTDENYSTIYNIDFYGNGFYYSKEAADTFLKTWNAWDGKHLYGGKNRMWFYYFIDRMIYDNLIEEENAILDSLTEQTPEGFIPSIDDIPNYEVENQKYEIRCAAEQLLCELESKYIQSSNIPEIITAEDFINQLWDELYGGWDEREEMYNKYRLEREDQREKEVAEELVCELESQSIEPDED